MNTLLNIYFNNLENYLVEAAELAGKSATSSTERGSGVEDFVAQILASHLPKRAAVTKHRQIIGADSNKSEKIGYGPSKPVDIIVYNEWTMIPNLLASGYVLAESVYLALEIKARKYPDDPEKGNKYPLKDEIANTIIYQMPDKKVLKTLRPETLYFGGNRRKNQLPLTASRTGRPTYGVIGIPWKNTKGEKETINVISVLEAIKRNIIKKDKIHKHNKNKNSIEENIKYIELPWNWPDLIYIPHNFLAFKIFTHIRPDPAKDECIETNSWNDEYPFIQRNNKWPPGDDNYINLNINDKNSACKMVYGYIEHNLSPLNLLYVLIFWLSNEILKFAMERPDYHRYLLDESALTGREAAVITEEGMWGISNYIKEGNKYRWSDPEPIRKLKMKK